MFLKDEVRDLAHDLREGGLTLRQLEVMCNREAKRLSLSPSELTRKVQAAYQALYVYV